MLYLSSVMIQGSLITGLIGSNLTKNKDKYSLNELSFSAFEVPLFILKSIINNPIIDLKSFDKQLKQNQNGLFKNNYAIASSELVITFFPLLIYNYQNFSEFSDELKLFKRIFLPSKLNDNSLDIFIVMINLIVNKQLNFISISSQVISDLNTNDEKNINQLKLIDELITNHLPLVKVEEKLSLNVDEDSLAICQSIYSFFSFPHNIENCLKRSTYFSQQSEKTAILTGYLLGLYHGYPNIPYQWRKSLELNPKIKEIEILTQKLVANWQGKMDN
ncbi:ADP-ribosylglycohydrolase family protein [Geminocystis sp. GBBB08]|uniref:ADP-ribosylglycohydrolase family protein n=1 Tax=Geminocystis sp. GBBB08 TaxID=2604140 RepID=UPI0027E21906|nr:ADP-ribosylglycohydrolase family protein [Geminocystis sp. GBBB08]MBL1210045.1 ADP-ribosylglycohydrolase family protein [Geminocystis sp. GBBB08]